MSFSITDETTIDDVKSYLKINRITQNITLFLLENGTADDMNMKDKNGNTALIWASYASNTKSTEDTVKRLIDKGANLNIQDNSGLTALIMASWWSKNISSEGTVKMLIDARADLNIKDNNGNTALIYASRYSNKSSTPNTVKILIDARADLNIKEKGGGNTALMIATRNSQDASTENTVKMLIDAGADLNIKDNIGETALIIASMYSNTTSTENTVKMLIDKGAKLNIKSNDGSTALIVASMYIEESSSEYTVQMLIDKGANLNIKNNNGYTAYDLLNSVDPDSYLLPLLKSEIETNPEITNNPLLEQRITVNISKTVSFKDAITLEDDKINIEDYIKKDKDNIVIVYNKNRYFFTTRVNINTQKDDATVYPCLKTDITTAENILEERPLYNIAKIGFVYGYHCDMEKYFNNPDHQLFALINTEEKYPSFISDDVLNRGGSNISGMHCQEGQGSKISYMIAAVPSTKDNPDTVQMGGFKKRRTIKKMKGKKHGKNKKRKTIKKRSKY